MRRSALLSLVAISALYGGGYKIPEVSLKGTALSAAYVANAYGADASYYNPANMALDDAGRSIEASVHYIAVGDTDFTGSAPSPDGSQNSSGATSEKEGVLAPSLHYMSDMVGDMRYGLSIVVPGGLTKRWEEQPAQSFAEEFSLKVIEINPTIGYKIDENLAIGGGLRMIYSSGTVKSASLASRELEGDSFDFGYNLALSYKLRPEWTLAATYRSNVNLTEEGDAQLYFPDDGTRRPDALFYSGDAAVSVPLPAVLTLAAAYEFAEARTVVELTYERVFWSSYEDLDFDYGSSIGALSSSFDDPIDKSWNDTNVWRLGVTKQYDTDWTLMAAVAYDETPVPQKSLNFEQPGSDSVMLSAGVLYRYTDNLDLGAAILVLQKEERDVTVNDNGISGTFGTTDIAFVSLGAEYRF